MSPTVMVVHDEELTRRAAALTLEVEGFHVIEHETGAAALTEVRGRVPEAIVAAAVLPDMTAAELAELVHALPGADTVPVVAQTAFAAARPIAGGPIADVLIEPVPPQRLVAAVRDQVARRGRRRKVGGGRTILLADDDPALLKLTRILLERHGFRVVAAPNVGDALAAAAVIPPDAVVSDVLMPDADGFELCLRLHRMPGLAQVPVVLMSSAYGEPADAELAVRVGAVGLVARSPDQGDVLAALVGALDGAAADGASVDRSVISEARRDRAVRVLYRQGVLTAELERKCALQRALLSAVATLSDALARVIDEHALPAAALRTVLAHSGATRGAIFLKDATGAHLAAAAGVGDAARAALAALAADPALARVLQQQEIVPVSLPEAQIGTGLLVPLTGGNEILGALLLGGSGGEIEHDEWVDFARAIGVHLGQALARARTRAELEVSNARYRVLIENAGEGMFVTRPSGEIVDVNRAAERQLGRTRAEIVGRSLADFLRDGAEPSLVRAGGGEVPADVSTSEVTIGSERVFLSIVRDVTERRRAERELAASEAKYRSLVENLPDVVWTMDLAGETSFTGGAFERIFGYRAEELRAFGRQGWEEHIHPDDQAATAAAFGAMFAEGRPVDQEHRFRRADGSWAWIHARAQRTVGPDGRARIEGLASDVTPRKTAELRLAESEAKYRTLVENMPELIMRLDAAGTLTIVGGAGKAMAGFTAAELEALGRQGFRERIHPDDRVAVLESFARFPAGGGDDWEAEFRFRHRDGSWIWFHVRLRATRYSDGAYVLEGLLSDITPRKLAELRQAETAAQYRTVFETSPLPMWIIDVETLSFMSVNGAMEQLYGYHRDELARMTARDIKLPADVAEMQRMMVQEQEPVRRVRTRHVHRDGRIMDVDLLSAKMHFAGRNARLLIGKDITADLQRERRLAAQNAMARAVGDARTVAEAAPRVVAAAAAAGGWQSGALWTVDANGAWSCAGAWNGDVRDDGRVERARASATPVHLPDGVAWPVRRGDEVIAVLDLRGRSGPDATLALTAVEERLVEPLARMRSAEERDRLARELRLLMDSTTEGICSVDRENRCTYANPAALRMLGYELDDLLGRNLHRLLHHTHADGRPFPEEECPLRAVVTEGTAVATSDDVMWRKDGTSFDANCRAAPIFVDGQVAGGVVSITDMTRERRLERQLRQAQRMEAIGRLAGGVAHDFNNILAVILSYASLLARDLGAEHELRPDADEIRRAAERGAALTRQLLAFSRQQMLEPRVINLNGVVTGVEKMLRRVIGEDIDLEVDLADDIGAVRADVGQIEQVVMNLVVNARDAMPDGGRLAIATRRATLDGGMVVEDAPVRPGRYILVSVADTGCGMTDDVRRRAFEPFFTTKERGQGTGLGLSTCYGIVRQSGGYISLYSEPGLGTEFKIYLPEVEAALDPISQRAAPLDLHGSETVLVIEDDDGVRAAVLRSLGRNGYRVLEARDGSEARRAASAHGGAIDLILSDVVTPHENGPQIVATLRALCPRARVLFMSGYSDHAAIGPALPGGAGFLQKPFSPESLAGKVRETLDSTRGSS